MRLRPLDYNSLPRWRPSELISAWPGFVSSCRAVIENLDPLRLGAPSPPEFVRLCMRAVQLPEDPATIQTFFMDNFQPLEVLNSAGQKEGFVTGYYEPEIEASTISTPEFSAPILARPDDLIDMRGAELEGWDRNFEGARRTPNGGLEPYPARAEIERGGIDNLARPIAWLRDPVEVFFAQVQGSARLRLPDGTRKRLTYAGRNGRPYTSIGRILIESGEVPAEEMSLGRCKDWLHAHGLHIGERGRTLLHSNESYVFFRLMDDQDSLTGPIGAQGVPLAPLRSIAVDRNIWPYGTPVWIGADLSSAGLGTGLTGRLMIAQDTGSAIVGAARGDLFIGSGDAAGEIAGRIRHSARFIVLAPLGPARHGGP